MGTLQVRQMVDKIAYVADKVRWGRVGGVGI
jgi:HD superfamily phosphohydrolase YqeK